MSLIFNLYAELISVLSRAVTGRLFTEQQIRSITSGAIGKYFAAFFPTPKEEIEARQKVDAAREHIAAASSFIQEMQANLESQNQSLEHLLQEIDEKKKLADRYQKLAQTNQEEFAAFRQEMEESLRKELTEQAAKGKRLRQVASLFIWVVTLVAGAALGAYFKEIVSWARGILSQP